jgi:hypothetical protein
MAGLKDGPHLHGKRLAAGVALPKAGTVALTLKAPSATYNATVGANWPIGPKMSLDEGIGGGLIVELLGAENGLGHGLTPCASYLIIVGGDVKYNIARLLRI